MDRSKKIDYRAFHAAGFYRFGLKAGIFFKRGIF